MRTAVKCTAAVALLAIACAFVAVLPMEQDDAAGVSTVTSVEMNGPYLVLNLSETLVLSETQMLKVSIDGGNPVNFSYPGGNDIKVLAFAMKNLWGLEAGDHKITVEPSLAADKGKLDIKDVEFKSPGTCEVQFTKALTVKENDKYSLRTRDSVAIGASLTLTAQELPGMVAKIMANGVEVSGNYIIESDTKFTVEYVSALVSISKVTFDKSYFYITYSSPLNLSTGQDLTFTFDGKDSCKAGFIGNTDHKGANLSLSDLPSYALEPGTHSVSMKAAESVDDEKLSHSAFVYTVCEVTFPEDLTVRDIYGKIESGTKVAGGTVIEVYAQEKPGMTAKIMANGVEIPYGKFTVETNTEFTVEYAETTKYAVTFGDGITVMDGTAALKSGDKVLGGTVVKVTAEDKTGMTAKIMANGAEVPAGDYTVNADVEFTVQYVDPGNMVTLTFKRVAGVTYTVNEEVVSGEYQVPAGEDVEIAALYKGEGLVELVIGEDRYSGPTWMAFPADTVIDADISGMKNMIVSGDSGTIGTEFSKEQTITVADTWTLNTGSHITILGKLVVPEGTTLVIEPNASITLRNPDRNAVVAEIRGNLVIEAADDENPYGALLIQSGKVDVYGNVQSSGLLSVTDNGQMTIKQDSNVVIEEEGEYVSESLTNIEKGAVLTLRGEYNFTSMNNSGTVVFDSSMPSENAFIEMSAAGATVDIVRIVLAETGRIQIFDDKTMTVVGTSSKGTDVIAEFTGLKIVKGDAETKKTTGADGIIKAGTFGVSGDVGVRAEYTGEDSSEPSDMSASAIVRLHKGGFSIVDSLVLGEGVTLRNDTNADTYVYGNLDASAAAKAIKNGGKITVLNDGHIAVLGSVIDSENGVNAIRYDVTESSKKYYHYVSLDGALSMVNAEGNTVTKLYAIGTNTLMADNTLPKDITLNLNSGSTLNIGEKNGDDVTLTIADGAKVKGAGDAINVNGTLYAECRSDIMDKAKATIVSDTYSEGPDEKGPPAKKGWAKWTNLAKALNDAEAGDVVEIYRDSGYVNVEDSIAIKEGVTLLVESGKAPLLLKNGVTLTVNGVLDTYPDVFAETKFGTTAMDTATATSSAIVVNGLLMASMTKYADGMTGNPAAMGDGAPIAGVYYMIETRYAISTLSVALGMIDDITSDLTAFGPVTSGDDAFTATAECKNLVVSDVSVMDMSGKDVASMLTVGTLTLSGSKLQAVGAFGGTVVVEDSALVVDGVKGFEIAKSADKVIGISGSPVLAGKTGSVTVSTGTAKADKLEATFKFAVSAGATLMVGTATLDNLVVDGTADVKTELNSATTTVNGGGKLNVSDSAAANIAVLNLGIVGSMYTGAEATLSGPVNVTGQAFVAPGAVIDAKAQEKLDMLKSTAYYVEEKLLMTVYDATGAFEIAEISKVTVTNAYFDGTWMDSKGMPVPAGKTVGSYDKVYANVVYDVYRIVIKADQGVDDVYLNGKQMSNGSITVGSYTYFAFFMTVKAGEYEVTYNLANGYAGEAKLYANGVAQSGNKFTATGTPADENGITMEFQLSGIQKSGYVDPTEPEKKGGLTITEILLIVLVVLVVIMAIIVALRLMRS